MDDDFNTPEALAVLFDLANELNKDKAATTAALLKQLAAIIGLLQRDPESFMQGEASSGELDIEAMIAARIAAKKAKDYAEADRIRKALADAGIVLEDTAQGTTWRRA